MGIYHRAVAELNGFLVREVIFEESGDLRVQLVERGLLRSADEEISAVHAFLLLPIRPARTAYLVASVHVLWIVAHRDAELRRRRHRLGRLRGAGLRPCEDLDRFDQHQRPQADEHERDPRDGVGLRDTAGEIHLDQAQDAQMLTKYIQAAGRPVTSQTQAARRVRHSHTVTPTSVRAARS